ncbi:MAG: hypothetical protein JSV28_01625 [Deltaproteobacteria bacterium]|nr:MAG: hypothetical protein JSV28_01625 [Deltaproteobacteria bacterium]
MKNRVIKYGFAAALVIAYMAAAAPPAHTSNGLRIAHLYNLADFTGDVPYNDAMISVDRYHDEIYVLFQNFVRIYNSSGMEVYGFGYDQALGWMRDLVVDEKGDIFLLSYGERLPGSDRWVYHIVHCNYRGQARGNISVQGLPPEFAHILPQKFFYREGRFLLVSRKQMLAVETDRNGVFRKGYNFADLLEIPEKDRPNTEIFGFSVDGQGNMLFTVPVLFQAFRVSPEGTVSAFGKGGSAPGLFGVVSGIVSDDHGNVLVADSQRSVVMVFDPKFQFITEFGYYGSKPQNLVRPRDIALGNSGKLYIVQLGQRGVSVFSVTPN